MIKKIFIILATLNITAYLWQSILSLSLSTKGDLLAQKMIAIDTTKNEIDSLEYHIVKANSLENAQEFAQKLNFTSINFTRFTTDSLADAKSKISL